MAVKVLLEKNARRQLEKLTEDVKDRIIVALNELEKGFSARAGFEIIFANDISIKACETYKKNLGQEQTIYHGIPV